VLRTSNHLSGVSLSERRISLRGVGKSEESRESRESGASGGFSGVWGTDMKAISSSDLATSWLFSTEFVKL